jgi:hypothetical protein
MSMVRAPEPSEANKLELPLPPGLYFSPTHQDSLGFLNWCIASEEKMPNVQGFIFHADMYAKDP